MTKNNNNEKQKPNYLDKDKYSLGERKKMYRESIEKIMNPMPVQGFDKKTFDPLAEEEIKEVSFRIRKKPPKKLPTFGLEPKEILEGQMIGMYESKQDLYLIMAHRINELQEEIELLKTKIK